MMAQPLRIMLRLALAAWMLLSLLRYLLIIWIKKIRYGDQQAYIRAKRRVAKSPMDTGHAWRVLKHVQQIADSCGARPFLVSGTLLGIHRHGGLLPHDNDMDLGLHLSDPALGELVQKLKKSPIFVELREDRLSWADRLLNPWVPPLPDNAIIYKFDFQMEGAERPVRLDLFVHFEASGFVAHGTTKSLWINRPFTLEDVMIEGVRFYAPANRHQYLSENYGDYQTPKPEFESFVDCPNCVNIHTFKAAVPIAKKWALFQRTRDLERQSLIRERIARFMISCLKRNPRWTLS